MYICIYVYMYMVIHMYMCIFIYGYVYIYIYMYLKESRVDTESRIVLHHTHTNNFCQQRILHCFTSKEFSS